MSDVVPNLHPSFMKYISDNLDPSVSPKLPFNCLECLHPHQSCNQYKFEKMKLIGKNVLKVQMILYLLPLLSRKIKDIYNNPQEEIPKVVKGYFWAVMWMTMGTWMSIVQLCHIHRYCGTFEKHWLMPMLSNFLGLMWVAVDYASRVK